VFEHSVYCIIIPDNNFFLYLFSVCFLAVGKGVKWASNVLKTCNKYYLHKKGHASRCTICSEMYVYPRLCRCCWGNNGF